MLDADTKRRIDTARDILVGKLPDPKSQIEQITIALIYKFMDDLDAESEEMGGERRFFTGDFARYGWAKLMSPSLGGQEKLNLYAEAIQRMPENPNLPALFREIFKNAYLPYRDPETLRLFLKTIDDFQYDHSERLGDAFEYLLSVMGSQGDAGQFRTPRHIIDFIVAIIDPQKGERILDPACGTAGFLISAYKHILAANRDPEGEITLTPDEKERLARNVLGYDISPDMVRLSLVNLYLHGFTDPHIHEYDTLTSEERWGEHADVILANPPFMTPTGGIRPHNQFSVQSKRSEVLFLDYIAEHLTADGKAGIIVPEGVHFVAQSSYTQLRRMLIENDYLLADITLPHGVFKPYASVKTHILFLNRQLARKSDSVLFTEIENDGFSQTDTREPLPGSQLQAAEACITSYKQAVELGSAWQKPESDIRAYEVAKNQLLGTRNCHLLGRWHDLPNRVIHRSDVPLMRLGDVAEIRDGLSPNMATQPGDYTMVVPAETRKTADHWDFQGKAICIPLVSSAGHGKADIKRIHYEEGKFALANTMCALFVKDEEMVRPRYLHLILSAMCNDLLVPLMCGATNVTMSSEQLAEIIIPVPERRLQDEVVEASVVNSAAQDVLNAMSRLVSSSSSEPVRAFAAQIKSDAHQLIKTTQANANISNFVPS